MSDVVSAEIALGIGIGVFNLVLLFGLVLRIRRLERFQERSTLADELDRIVLAEGVIVDGDEADREPADECSHGRNRGAPSTGDYQ